MEQEICRREAKSGGEWCKVAIIVSLIYAGVAIIPGFIIGAINNDLFTPEHFMGHYWHSHGHMLLGLLCAGIFTLLMFLLSKSYELVLTDKRIYRSITRKQLFSKTITITENYNLSKINNYTLIKVSNKKRSYSQLSLSTSSSHATIAVDTEFYNQFIEAVNNAV